MPACLTEALSSEALFSLALGVSKVCFLVLEDSPQSKTWRFKFATSKEPEQGDFYNFLTYQQEQFSSYRFTMKAGSMENEV